MVGIATDSWWSIDSMNVLFFDENICRLWRLKVLRTEKISNLTVSHFVKVAGRGSTAYSVVSITIDGMYIPELLIVGETEPHSGMNVIAAFRGNSKNALVGWLDPVTKEPVVVIPNIVTYFTIIIPILIPLMMIALLAAPESNRELWFYFVVSPVFAVFLIQAIGWPGVARHLKKALAESEDRYP